MTDKLLTYRYPRTMAEAAQLRAQEYRRTHRRVVVPVRRYDPARNRWCTQRVAGPFDDQPTFDLS